jgi:prepilin peptidase CpaA
VEIGMLDFAVDYQHAHTAASYSAWTVVLAAATLGAFIDARARKLPNLLTFPLFLCGLIFSAATGHFASSVEGCLLLFIPYLLLFIFAGGGAGDAKMMGAIGAWIGFAAAIPVLVAVALSGGLLAIGYALVRRRTAAVTANLRAMTLGVVLFGFYRTRLVQAQEVLPDQEKMLTMPYGISILVGTALAAVWVLACH